MKSIKRFIGLTLVMAMVFQNTGSLEIGAATAKGTTLRLEATEGTVTVKNSTGADKTIKSGMKLYRGDTAATAAKSYAYISLDKSKAVKMDENSVVSIKQNGTENEVMLSEGNLMFNVAVPLKKKESLNIRTSTMVTGVRGTIGVSKHISDDESVLYLLEGHTEVKYIENKTRKVKTASVTAGELLDVTRVKGKKAKGTIASKVKLSKITEEDIDDFVVIEIGRNLDIQERLRKGGIFDVDKILQRYWKLRDTGKYITLGGRSSSGSGSANTVTSGNTVVSSNNTGTANSGGSSGGGGGSSGGGGGSSGGGGGSSGGGTAPSGNGGNNGNTDNGGNGNANTGNNTSAPVVMMMSGYTPNNSYAINTTIPPLSVTVNVSGGTANVTYQWYSSDVAGERGTAIDGETNSSFTPPSDTLGTTYYTCVASIESDDAVPSEKESEQYKITILKKSSISNVSAPAAPDYENIGFNFIEVPEVTTYTPAAVSVQEGIDKDNGTIRLQSVGNAEKHTLVLNAPGDTETIPEGSVIEYACVPKKSAPTRDDKWQTERRFENLKSATTYYCFSRVGASDDTAASEPSAACEVVTKGGEEIKYYTDKHIEYRIVSDNGVYTAACGFEFHEDKTGKDNRYFDYEEDIIIPESISLYGIENIPVTEVFDYGFYGGSSPHYNMFSKGGITLPESIKVIGKNAFDHIVAPDGVKLGSGIEIIGDYAFQNAMVIYDEFPKNVKEIGAMAFSGCGIETLSLPDKLEKIGNGAFVNCDSLRTITFPDSLTSIGAGTFLNCDNLKNVHLPSKLTAVSDNTFMNCSALESITLPDTVTEIGYQAFKSCHSLMTINIPKGVKYIGKSAFQECGDLTSLTLPATLKTIGPQAFAYCEKLTEMTIPEGVTTLDYWTFRSCKDLVKVYLPSSLEKILTVDELRQTGRYPFQDCNDALVIYYPGASVPDGFAEDYARISSSSSEVVKTATVTLNYTPEQN